MAIVKITKTGQKIRDPKDAQCIKKFCKNGNFKKHTRLNNLTITSIMEFSCALTWVISFENNAQQMLLFFLCLDKRQE